MSKYVSKQHHGIVCVRDLVRDASLLTYLYLLVYLRTAAAAHLVAGTLLLRHLQAGLRTAASQQVS